MLPVATALLKTDAGVGVVENSISLSKGLSVLFEALDEGNVGIMSIL